MCAKSQLRGAIQILERLQSANPKCGQIGILEESQARSKLDTAGSYTFVLTVALLRLDPIRDPLRSDPAFEKLCEEKQLQ